MDEVELRRFRVVVELDVDAEDAEHARREVAGICEVATEDDLANRVEPAAIAESGGDQEQNGVGGPEEA